LSTPLLVSWLCVRKQQATPNTGKGLSQLACPSVVDLFRTVNKLLFAFLQVPIMGGDELSLSPITVKSTVYSYVWQPLDYAHFVARCVQRRSMRGTLT
jgi:hypothetical protein